MLDRAENELKMRQAELRSQEQQVLTQKLRIQQEQATLETDRYNLSKVRIESPINGIVTRRNGKEMVVVGTMNNAGTVLLTIADMSVIEAEVDVDETDIPQVKLGQVAKITIDAVPDKTYRQGHRDRQQPDSDDDGAERPARRPPTSRSSSPSTPRFRTCARASRARRDHDGDAGERARAADSGDDRARDGRGRQGGDRPHADRPTAAARRRRAGLGAAAGPVAELEGCRRARRRGGLLSGQDRDRRREVFRGRVRREGRGQRRHRPVQLGARAGDGVAVKVEQPANTRRQ